MVSRMEFPVYVMYIYKFIGFCYGENSEDHVLCKRDIIATYNTTLKVCRSRLNLQHLNIFHPRRLYYLLVPTICITYSCPRIVLPTRAHELYYLLVPTNILANIVRNIRSNE